MFKTFSRSGATACALAALAIGLGGCAGGVSEETRAAEAVAPEAAAVVGALGLKAVSARPDLVSGGDVLVEVTASEGARIADVEVFANGQAIGAPLRRDPAGEDFQVLVSGLRDGANVIEARTAAGASARLNVVNHPIAGPILSGPHMTPYECRTEASGLGPATDADCSAPTRYDWFFKGEDGVFHPLENPKLQQAEIARTTTIDGRTVPYIVRVESGVINRAIYRIAMLDDPTTPNTTRNEGWNDRLAITFGGGCGTNYNQGSNTADSALNDLFLSRGFAFMNSTELVNQLHCNGVLQGETTMMLKEHFVETYGVPKWTVGVGGSGGAIQQLLITEMYPGVLDGLQPSVSFPDSALHTPDCGLMQNFFKSPDAAGWTDEQKTAVTGFYGTTCASWARSFVPVVDATNKKGCGLSDLSLVYDRKTNPKGARCTIQDLRVNIYGRDPKTGFARKPDDNVGLQYGLKALNAGTISVDQFLTLNEKIGGNDVDGAFRAERSVGDPEAIRAVYASGTMNTGGGGLANVPIINFRAYSDTANDIHSRERDLTIRARLENANGDADNQVIWVAGPRGRPGTPEAANAVDLPALVLNAMTKWLDAMAADPAPLSHAKVVKHKPSEAVDGYFDAQKTFHAERASWDNSTAFNKTYPVHLEPRLVAGAPPANDIMKCQLKPVDMADYKATFSAAQTARLKAVFPDGVCDWSKPGVDYSLIKATYQKY
ncbi:MAG: DUF6351 family protein [Hyphomonadaceae bacterium]